MDKEMIAEYNKALKIAYQYRINTIRIRRLLNQSPITVDNGARLVNAYTGKILLGQIIKYDDTLSDYPYVSSSLFIR